MDLYKKILRLFFHQGLEAKMTEMKRKYGKTLKKMGIEGDEVEVAILETCIEVAQDRIAELRKEKKE